MPEELDYVKSSYYSPFGKIVSNWRKNSSESYIYEITVPEGSVANVLLPISPSQKIMIKKDDFKLENIDSLRNGKFRLNNGDYIITVSD